MGSEGVEETLQTAVDPLIRNTVFKENNNLVLSGKDYLESFLVGALSVGALHAKSTAIGLSTDAKTMKMDIKLPDGTYVASDVINRYFNGQATESDVKQIKQLGSSINEENMNSVLKRMDDIANVKMGKDTYGEMNKKTAGMSAYDKISYFSDVMSSPEFKAHTEELIKTAQEQKAKAEGKKGVEGVDTGNNGVNNNDSKTERISSNPDNPNINPNDAGSLQTSANPNDNNGDGLGNAGTMLANKTPDPQKPDDDIPMEKAANGYEYDAYDNTDANGNNSSNKPLTMESRNEGQGGGNDIDVFNKGDDDSSSGSNGIDTDNGLSENNKVNDASHVNSDGSYGNAGNNSSQDNANDDGIEYKGEEGKENLEINKNIDEELEHYNKILSYEPKITEFITDMASKLSMNIEGLEYRIKSKDSYLRKLEDIENEDEIRDIIRYTYSDEPNILSNKIIQSIEEFNTKGYNTIKIKNTWIDDFTPYKGINTIVETPNGITFELQYHTPESFNLKNGQLHKLYEKQRIIKDTTSDEYIKLNIEMFELSKILEKPTGIERLKNK